MVVGWRGFPSGLDRVNLWVLICLNNTGERWAGCGGGNTQCFGKSREHGRVGREGSEEGTPKIHCLRVHSWTCGAVTSSLFAHACQLSSLSRLLLSPPNLPLNDHPSFPQPFPPAPPATPPEHPIFPILPFSSELSSRSPSPPSLSERWWDKGCDRQERKRGRKINPPQTSIAEVRGQEKPRGQGGEKVGVLCVFKGGGGGKPVFRGDLHFVQ